MSNFPRTAHTFDYPRYLKALQPVSARAQSDVLYQRFIDTLLQRFGGADDSAPVRVLEIGAGRGDQMDRVLNDASAQGRAVDYTALEPDADNRAVAASVADSWNAPPHAISVHSDSFLSFRVDLPYDAVIARSVLDLVHLKNAWEKIKNSISNNGILYAPLTFGMGTHLAPHPGMRVARIESSVTDIYHQTIQQKTSTEDGTYPAQEIAAWASQEGAQVDMRASDWVIAPSKRRYKNDEAYALQSILAFMHDEAEGTADIPQSALDMWWATRMRMLHNSTLIYTANQFDLLIR